MNENRKMTGISREASLAAECAMEAVAAGRIKKHLLGNTTPIRYGTMERQEMMEYEAFIKTKLCFEILQLEGKKAWKEETDEYD